MERHYFVYIMSSRSKTLYVGVTNNLIHRTLQHKTGVIQGFTSRYNIHRLVYVEHFADIRLAISREKQIKSWRREKKIALIEHLNPTWQDLAEQWSNSAATADSSRVARTPPA